jgi:hypothetical protein
MSQEQLIRRVAESASVTDEQVQALDLEQAESELLNAITSELVAEQRPDTRAVRLKRRRFALRAGAALAGAAAAAALIFSGNEPGGGGAGGVAYAAEWIRIAEANPRLLVTAPGWEVTRADEYKRDYGETTFSDGGVELDLFWYPIGSYPDFYDDRARDSDETQIELLGRGATLFDSGSGTYSAMFRPGGDTFVEIRGDVNRRLDRDGFLALLDALEAVDVETWLAALPASVVRASDRSTTVDAMLDGIPLPPGLDVESLKQGETARDRYQLGALVTGAVTCAWLERRMSGLQTGDSAKVKEAEDALATAPTWPILLEMQAEGDWSDEVWDWAEDGRGSTGWGRNTTENPAGALGCAARDWRDVPQVDPRAKAGVLKSL